MTQHWRPRIASRPSVPTPTPPPPASTKSLGDKLQWLAAHRPGLLDVLDGVVNNLISSIGEKAKAAAHGNRRRDDDDE